MSSEGENRKKVSAISILIRVVPLIAGIYLYNIFSYEELSVKVIISMILIFGGLTLTTLHLLPSKQKLSIVISLLLTVLCIWLTDLVCYGGYISVMKDKLDNSSPFSKTVVKSISFHKGFTGGKRRRHDKSKDKWVYFYDISVDGITYPGATTCKREYYSVGDSIKVLYNSSKPKINRMVIYSK